MQDTQKTPASISFRNQLTSAPSTEMRIQNQFLHRRSERLEIPADLYIGRPFYRYGQGLGLHVLFRLCNGHVRSYWQHLPCHKLVALDGKADGRCQCGPRLKTIFLVTGLNNSEIAEYFSVCLATIHIHFSHVLKCRIPFWNSVVRICI